MGDLIAMSDRVALALQYSAGVIQAGSGDISNISSFFDVAIGITYGDRGDCFKRAAVMALDLDRPIRRGAGIGCFGPALQASANGFCFANLRKHVGVIFVHGRVIFVGKGGAGGACGTGGVPCGDLCDNSPGKCSSCLLQ